MHAVRRLHAFSKYGRLFSSCSRRLSASRNPLQSHFNADVKDKQDDPIPTEPTWSIHELLASYPRPRITHAELTKLHKLSALLPPEEGSEAAERMHGELEELVRLVEAVKLVDTSDTEAQGSSIDESTLPIPDGRIWEEGRGMILSSNTRAEEFEDPEIEAGTALLKYAKETKDGCYFIEADRRKK